MSILGSRSIHPVSLAAVALCLSACAASGGELARAPVPPPAPPPPPLPRAEPPMVALAAPVQSDAPAVIEAAEGGPNFDEWSEATYYAKFPLTHTAAAANFDGDPAETAKPRFLILGDVYSDSTLGYSRENIAHTPYVRIFSDIGPSAYLEWTLYGYWGALSPAESQRGAWVMGLQTPLALIPVSGSARYAGRVAGLYSEYHACTCYAYARLAGNVTMTADFGGRSVSGTMTNLMVTSEREPSGPMSDISFAATFAPDRNQFSGTTSLASAGSGPWALAAGASGAITGHFYGPGAQEAGAAWTLSDGTHRVIGSFGAGRQ